MYFCGEIENAMIVDYKTYKEKYQIDKKWLNSKGGLRREAPPEVRERHKAFQKILNTPKVEVCNVCKACGQQIKNG